MSLPVASAKRNSQQTHGMRNSRVYAIWTGMISRCRIPSATSYENYGGRGIKVCDRWLRFEDFLADMGEPALGQSIERNDGDGNYEPSNCRWATRVEQNRNQRDLRYVEFRGESKCLSAWAEEVGSTFGTLKARINRGWPIERVLLTPVRAHKNYERRTA